MKRLGKSITMLSNLVSQMEMHDEAINGKAFEIFDLMADRIEDYNKFAMGKSDVQSWIELNRKIRGQDFRYDFASIEMMLGEKDKKLELAPRPYLRQYINDNAKDKTVIKCRQSEFTESEINENIYLCAVRPFTNISHIFPTSSMAHKMAKEKISPAIDMSPTIFELMKRPFNFTSKSFQNGSFYTVDSSWTDYQGRGPSRDKITFDEYESQNPHIEDIYSESASHSDLGRKVRISTPMFPNSGIDGMYLKGCQYEWIVVCPKCKKEQTMEFPENIIGYFDTEDADIDDPEYEKRLNAVYIGCKYCGEYIDKSSQHYIDTSRWIAVKQHLMKNKPSYRVTYMMLAWKTGKEILWKYHTFKFVHQFWNEIMGYAYVSPEAQINREIFEQCQDKSMTNRYQRLGMAKNVSIGVDWGEVSWVVVRANGFPPDKNKPYVIYVERIDRALLLNNGYGGTQMDHPKRVEEIASFFSARIIINDANGLGVDRNAYLVNKYPTRCYGCFYDTDEQQKQKRKEKLLTPQWSESARRVTVSRLATMRMMIQEYEEKKISIPRLDVIMELFIKHHANLCIERYVDEKTDSLYEVVGKKGEDHFAHADNYAKIGFDKIFNIHTRVPAGVISGVSDIESQMLNNIHQLYDK